jgi:hypothetical protein
MSFSYLFAFFISQFLLGQSPIILNSKLLIRQYLFQRDVGVAFPEHVLFQLQLAMLDGRDGDAVDVAEES